MKTIENNFKNPFGVFITDDGESVWVADRDTNKVFKLNRSSIFNECSEVSSM